MMNNCSSMFSLLGLGACGGNQVKAYSKYPLKSLYINSAEQDLLSLGKNIQSYLIPDAIGCHKDRNLSKQYLAEHFDDVIRLIERVLDTRYIFVHASTSGGTGSGLVALLCELIESELHKICIPILTVPDLQLETLQGKINCYETLQEIIGSNKHTLFLVDNNKATNYQQSNAKLADLIYHYISDISTSTDGILDQSEICTMLEMKGYGVLNSYKDSKDHNITVDVINALASGIHVNPELHNVLYYIGFKNVHMKKTIDIQFDDIKQKFGFPRDIFKGYQTKYNMICMTGLNYPSHIIDSIYKSIQADQKKLEKDKEMSQNIHFQNVSIGIKKEETAVKEPVKLSARERLMKMSKK